MNNGDEEADNYIYIDMCVCVCMFVCMFVCVCVCVLVGHDFFKSNVKR